MPLKLNTLTSTWDSILKVLEEKGMLENTLIIVTSDNGMPFPRSKAQEYPFSTHMPLGYHVGRWNQQTWEDHLRLCE